MTVNDLIVRARGYVYEREGWEAFLQEILEGEKHEQRMVAEYLAGHGLMIASWVPADGAAQSWYWMDSRYRDAMVEVMRLHKGHYRVLGWGQIETPSALASIPLRLS